MKALVISALLALAAISSELSTNDRDTMLDGAVIAATARDHAAVVGAQAEVDLNDHYGNPAHFIQYIIRVPPIHA